MTDDLWNDPFHVIAFESMIIEARAAGGWPDPEKVRQRAYATFEAEKRATPAPSASRP